MGSVAVRYADCGVRNLTSSLGAGYLFVCEKPPTPLLAPTLGTVDVTAVLFFAQSAEGQWGDIYSA